MKKREIGVGSDKDGLSKEYYENLLAEIREIRASERKFYQKITDIYATAMDYNAEAETTQTFFATMARGGITKTDIEQARMAIVARGEHALS